MPSGIMHLLKIRRFLPLFITQFLGAFNDNVFKNACVMLITYRLSEMLEWDAQLLVTLAAGIFIFPFFLFSAFSGELADRYEKSQLIRIIKTIEIILMIIAMIGFYQNNILLLFFVLFMLGTHSTFFGPLKYAVLPEHLHANELLAGNGLIEAGTFLAILTGTILGGILILLPGGELYISIVLFSVALSGFVSSLFIPVTKAHMPDVRLNYNIFLETVRILRYAYSQPFLFAPIIGISWFWFIGAVFLAEFPVFSKNELHADQYVVTYFFALFSLGIGVGSLACNQLLKGRVQLKYVPWSAVLISIFTIDLYWTVLAYQAQPFVALHTLRSFLGTYSGWHISVDLLFIAMGGGLYTVPLYVTLQQLSAASHRARVIASNNVMNALFMVVAALMTMLALQQHFSVTQIFLGVGLLNVGFAFYLYCKLPKT